MFIHRSLHCYPRIFSINYSAVVRMKKQKTNAGWIQFLDFGEDLGVETVYGQQVIHHFTRHTHRTLCLGIIEEGVRIYCCRQQRYEVIPGQVFIIPPQEAHTCSTNEQEFHTYRLLFVSPDLLAMIIGDAGKDIHSQLLFNELVIDNKKAFDQLNNLHSVLESNETRLTKQSFIISVVSNLIEQYTNVIFDFSMNCQHAKNIERIRIFIEEHYWKCFSLADIAQIIYLNPFYLLRTFSQILGVPPHIYQQQVRIRHAKQLLAQKVPIAEVASHTGFVDQSHFTRVFKKIVGMTPGEYRI